MMNRDLHKAWKKEERPKETSYIFTGWVNHGDHHPLFPDGKIAKRGRYDNY